jgi:hypothetical protein
MTLVAVRHEYVSDDLLLLLAGRLVVDAGQKGIELDDDMACRAMCELIDVYLPLVDAHPGLRPSVLVDEAWHTFILHMVDYEEFCQRRFGRMLYHQPGVIEAPTALSFMCEHGISFDPQLWTDDTDCRNGGSGGGCADTK